MEYDAVTESVALEVARFEGSGAPEEAYTLAAESFEEELEKLSVSGRIAILRENRTDESGAVRSLTTGSAVMKVGDPIGSGDPEADLAVEPVEGTMPRTPDMYMCKLIVGPRARDHIDIDASAENIEAIAASMGRRPSELTVAVLDRDRHVELIEEIRATGARIQIRPEGGLTPAIAVGLRGADLHAVIGIGGAPEGVLAAAAIKCLGGGMQARMWPTQRSQVEKLREYGLEDPERKLTLDDLVRGEGTDYWRDASGGALFPGRWSHAYGCDVHGAAYDKIHRHHPRPRARRRDAGIPALKSRRNHHERTHGYSEISNTLLRNAKGKVE